VAVFVQGHPTLHNLRRQARQVDAILFQALRPFYRENSPKFTFLLAKKLN
jgi:hypothetical protein